MSVRSCLALAFAGATLATISPSTSHADAINHFVLRGEGGGGILLPGFQTQQLGEQAVAYGAGRLGVVLFDPIALQASFASYYFPDDNGGGQLYTVSGGLRFEPMLGHVARFFVDVNAGLGITGGLNRFALDAGIGLEFALTRGVGLGPMARFVRVFPGDPAESEANFVVGGLSLSLRVPEAEHRPPPAPTDSDRDGVLDPQDLCPMEPAGAHPDPQRPGCPLVDSDSDGVDDAHDICPHEAQGEHPDPQRVGCAARDTDSDGVFEPEDQCPTTAQGEHPDPDRPGCPDGDEDADGVLNHQDQCPHDAAGLHPDPARAGCPAPDRDHDSVPDATDACPDQPGAPNPEPRRNGCPGLVRVEHGQIVIVHPVFFATDRDRILRNSFGVLQAVADAMTAQPEIRRVSVEGHTDNQGLDAHNMDLSQRRAQSVVNWLVSHHVAADRLEAHGYGASRPILPNETSVGRAANRRVEFHIIDPPQLAGSSAGPSLAPVTSAAPASAAPTQPEAPAEDGHQHHHHHHHEAAPSEPEGHTHHHHEHSPAAPGEDSHSHHHHHGTH